MQVGNHGFASHDYTVRMNFPVQCVAGFSIIVPCNVQHIQEGAHEAIHLGALKRLVPGGIVLGIGLVEIQAGNTGIHRPHQHLDKKVHGGGRLLRLILVAVGIGQDAEVNTAGDGPCTVQFVYSVNHLRCNLHSSRKGRLCEFIADGIHYHGRMIPILSDHRLKVFLKMIGEVRVIIVFHFTGEPAVIQFIHYIHSQPVTGTEHLLRERIMGRADGVEAHFFQF